MEVAKFRGETVQNEFRQMWVDEFCTLTRWVPASGDNIDGRFTMLSETGTLLRNLGQLTEARKVFEQVVEESARYSRYQLQFDALDTKLFMAQKPEETIPLAGKLDSVCKLLMQDSRLSSRDRKRYLQGYGNTLVRIADA